jgi:hypothetical protein
MTRTTMTMRTTAPVVDIGDLLQVDSPCTRLSHPQSGDRRRPSGRNGAGEAARPRPVVVNRAAYASVGHH